MSIPTSQIKREKSARSYSSTTKKKGFSVRHIFIKNIKTDPSLCAALARKESRGNHIRADFPFTNPLLADQFLTVGLDEDGQVKTAWRPVRQAIMD